MRSSKIAFGAGMLVLALAATPAGAVAAIDGALPSGEGISLTTDLAGVRLATEPVEVNVNAPVNVLTDGSGNVNVDGGTVPHGGTLARLEPAQSRPSSTAGSQPSSARSVASSQVQPKAGHRRGVDRANRIAREQGRSRKRASASEAGADPAGAPARQAGDGDRGRRIAKAGERRWESRLPKLLWEKAPDIPEWAPSALPDFRPAATTASLPLVGMLIATLGGLLMVAGFRLRKLAS